MREILFRGKRVDNGEWETGSLVITRSGCSDEQVFITDKMTGYLTPVIPETVDQYTGLTDKNGKKIFEGDIVNCVYDGDLRTYIVVWDKEELDFKATNGEESFGNNFRYLCCNEEVEIIGNIHDNPELMDDSTADEDELAEEGD